MPDSLPIETEYEPIWFNDSCTLLEVHLITGRTHQIRCHMSSIGHPLIGDFLYNPTNNGMQRQALHAWHLSFRHPITKEEIGLEAPVPEDMKEFWKLQK